MCITHVRNNWYRRRCRQDSIWSQHRVWTVLNNVLSLGLLIDIIAIIGVALGLVLVLIAWMFLKPVKKEEWLYAVIVNMVTIPVSYLLLPEPLWAFPITFAVLIIIIMIIPPIRKPYT